MTGGALCWLKVSNWAVVVATLGLAKPLCDLRSWRFLTANVELVGPLDLATVRYKPGTETAAGEAMTDFVGSGLSLEI